MAEAEEGKSTSSPDRAASGQAAGGTTRRDVLKLAGALALGAAAGAVLEACGGGQTAVTPTVGPAAATPSPVDLPTSTPRPLPTIAATPTPWPSTMPTAAATAVATPAPAATQTPRPVA